jgi:hypothetical protein
MLATTDNGKYFIYFTSISAEIGGMKYAKT